MIKKILGFAAGTGMLLATVAPAFAVSINCANQTTGSGSFNDCVRSSFKTKTLNVTSTGNIVNNLVKTARSGNNTANDNTSGGSVTTAEASADLDSASALNTGDVTVAQNDSAADETGLNDTTGSTSNNTVNITTNRTVTLDVVHYGDITNNVTATAVSGDNSASNNTVGGTVVSGVSRISVFLTNILNSIVVNVTQ